MEISLEILLSIIGILIAIIGGTIAYCVRIESKFKDLENEMKILKPLKKVLEEMGTEHVIKIFKEKKP